jgi:hypothetical protein
MSQYPFGYGQWPPPPPSLAQSHPQEPQNHTPYRDYRNSFDNAYVQQSQASFNMNANQIPGLGVPSPTPIQHGGHFGPSPTSWSAPIPPPAITPSHFPVATPQPRSHHAYNPPPLPVYQEPAVTPQSTLVRETASKASQAMDITPPIDEDPLEEGELGFDDLYEPSEDIVTSKPPARPLVVSASSSTGEDDQGNAFYDEEPGEIRSNASKSPPASLFSNSQGLTTSQARPGLTGRQRSGSYSPYLSPREIHHEDTSADEREIVTIGPASNNDVLSARDGVPATDVKGSNESVINVKSDGVVERGNINPVRSFLDVKKEAQKSILRLFTHGVRFQTFLDEGFDEILVKSLFTDLGLNSSTTSHHNPEASKETNHDANKGATNATQMQMQATGSRAENKQEERKDRIARLLAEKASKAAAAKSPQLSEPVSKPAAEMARSDKNRLLQQKLEALQARRTAPSNGVVASPRLHGAQMSSTAKTLFVDSPAQAAAADSPNASSSAQAFPSNLTSQPPGPPRKRPVAADFVDYATKRPFGQARQQSSLVIDVTDESDGDVEMDIESPGDAAASLHQRPGPSIRDFPPLSELAQRQYASSASSVPTPPNGNALRWGKPQDGEYERKMREIEDMRRRIAAAEAKKANTTNEVRSPQRKAALSGQGSTPEITSRRRESAEDSFISHSSSPQSPQPTISARLSKTSDVRATTAVSRMGRRERLASFQIPKVEAALQEKMAKKQLFQEKLEQLDQEIERYRAEKVRLVEEMTSLEQESSSSSQEPPNAPSGGSNHLASPAMHSLAATVDEEDGDPRQNVAMGLDPQSASSVANSDLAESDVDGGAIIYERGEITQAGREHQENDHQAREKHAVTETPASTMDVDTVNDSTEEGEVSGNEDTAENSSIADHLHDREDGEVDGVYGALAPGDSSQIPPVSPAVQSLDDGQQRQGDATKEASPDEQQIPALISDVQAGIDTPTEGQVVPREVFAGFPG